MTRVLIVDDEPAIRRLLRGALERVGYDVVEAADASAALNAAKAPVALVLLDLGLPGRDGLELVPLLKVRTLRSSSLPRAMRPTKKSPRSISGRTIM